MATVVKSDVLVNDIFRGEICQAFNKLYLDQAESPDWQPGTHQSVRNLIDPSMYPLVFDQTRVFRDEVVGIQDAIWKWSGKGEIITKGELVKQFHIWWPLTYWSNEYQWLPANVAFQEDGSVKFTSYINSLHPNIYPEIYRTVEKLIEKVLPMWDQCLLFEPQNPSRFDPPQDSWYVRTSWRKDESHAKLTTPPVISTRTIGLYLWRTPWIWNSTLIN
jgi:hypothetical protein